MDGGSFVDKIKFNPSNGKVSFSPARVVECQYPALRQTQMIISAIYMKRLAMNFTVYLIFDLIQFGRETMGCEAVTLIIISSRVSLFSNYHGSTISYCDALHIRVLFDESLNLVCLTGAQDFGKNCVAND